MIMCVSDYVCMKVEKSIFTFHFLDFFKTCVLFFCNEFTVLRVLLFTWLLRKSLCWDDLCQKPEFL